MNQECYSQLLGFEKEFHTAIWEWIRGKMHLAGVEGAEVLDISEDYGIFSQLLADVIHAKRVVIACRNGGEKFVRKGYKAEVAHVKLEGEKFDFKHLGKFDIVILRDVLHEVDSITKILKASTEVLKCNKQSKIFAVTRPKNPPLPLPSDAMEGWRKYVPSRKHMIISIGNSELGCDCFAASVPVEIDPHLYGTMLKARTLPAIKMMEITDKDIDEFADRAGLGGDIFFEEKILIYRLWPFEIGNPHDSHI